MNREIKLRLWNPMKSEMKIYDHLSTLPPNYTAVPVMQFTGLLDKNGKEIYEGDIMLLGDTHCPITWEDGSFHMKFNPSQGRSAAIQDRLKHFEIIGNIYENPELITL